MTSALPDYEATAFAHMIEMTPPQINIALPEAERQEAASITLLLILISRLSSDFADAVALFDHLESVKSATYKHHRLPHEWTRIAARDAVVTVHKIAEVLKLTSKTLNRSPSIKRLAGKDAVEPIVEEFDSKFQGSEDMRDSTVHVVERFGKPGDRDRHTIANLNGVLVPHFYLADRVVTIQSKGRTLSLEISQESVEKIQETVRRIFRLFRQFDTNPGPPNCESAGCRALAAIEVGPRGHYFCDAHRAEAEEVFGLTERHRT